MSKKNAKNSELIDELRMMILIRRFEEQAGQLYGAGFIGGFCHLCIGQEAIAVGIKSVLKKGDTTITSYRDHGLMLAAGSDPKVVMSELTGRIDGCSKGKGGSMHMFDLEKGFFGGHGIVGAQVPIGTGLAFAHKYKKDNGVCFTLLGDGASNQGQFFEAMNMAALWELPVVYIIENNQYGMGTSIARCSAITDLHNKGLSTGIEGMKVNGMDLFETKAALKKATDECRKKHKPQLLSIDTYRYRGHSMSDPATYRSKEEVDNMKQKHDSIEGLKGYIIKNKIMSEEEIKSMDKDIRTLVKEAAEFAKNSPEPDESELWTDVYTMQ